MPSLDERLEAIVQSLEFLRDLSLKNEKAIETLTERSNKLDVRIDRLYHITLKIGADFYQRLLKLENESSGELN